MADFNWRRYKEEHPTIDGEYLIIGPHGEVASKIWDNADNVEVAMWDSFVIWWTYLTRPDGSKRPE